MTNLNMVVLWEVTPCCLREVQGALMMEAVSSSETLVKFCQTARRYKPEDGHRHIARRQNPKYCLTYSYASSFVGVL
jgi:hypothetical protein